jgi:hypothetical protein
MIYKHQYFQLNAESKKVFDENGKELILTGNAYRMLVFLCEKKNANLTQIGEYLDFAKDYNENHLRQYRYKINTIIGKNVIEYKNSIYSLIGEAKEDINLSKIERNTDLLHADIIKLEHKFINTKSMSKSNKILTGVASVVLLTAIILAIGYSNIPQKVYQIFKPEIRKSSYSDICYEKGNDPYGTIKNYTPYNSMADCLAGGGKTFDALSPNVKKSRTSICHGVGTTYYNRTSNFTGFDSIDDCVGSSARLPYN